MICAQQDCIDGSRQLKLARQLQIRRESCGRETGASYCQFCPQNSPMCRRAPCAILIAMKAFHCCSRSSGANRRKSRSRAFRDAHRWRRKRTLISGRQSHQCLTTRVPIDALVFSPPVRQAGVCPRRQSATRWQRSLSASWSLRRTIGHSPAHAPISDCSSAARRRPCRSDWYSVHRIARPPRDVDSPVPNPPARLDQPTRFRPARLPLSLFQDLPRGSNAKRVRLNVHVPHHIVHPLGDPVRSMCSDEFSERPAADVSE